MSNVDSMVNGKRITLAPKTNADGSLSWVWGWSADFLDSLDQKVKADPLGSWCVNPKKKNINRNY